MTFTGGSGGGGGTINGTIASTQVAYGTGADTIGGENEFTYDATTNVLEVPSIVAQNVIQIDAGTTIVDGNPVRLATSSDAPITPGTLIPAYATTFSSALVVGIAQDGGVAGDTIKMVMNGSANVLFGSAPASSSNGQRVYLSTSSGLATLTAPTGTGEASLLIGYLIGADGANTKPTVLLKIGDPVV